MEEDDVNSEGGRENPSDTKPPYPLPLVTPPDPRPSKDAPTAVNAGDSP